MRRSIANTVAPTPIRFAVEWTSPRLRVVAARRLDDGDFFLTPRLRLDPYPVHSFQIPRALDADGNPRRDLFAFWVSFDECGPPPQGAILELTFDE
jgi:hypothetical protein